MNDFFEASVLLLVILNPFGLSVYLVDMYRSVSLRQLGSIMLRASLISGAVFALFAAAGDAIFTDVLHLRFAAFQVFGGILFLGVALRFMLSGSETLVQLRGEPGRVAGAVAMPFMIGPGTVSAATIAGLRLDLPFALLAVAAALATAVIILLLLKVAFDRVQKRNAALVERYVETAGRVSAMVVGSIAVEMVFVGIDAWWRSPPS